MPKRDRDDEPPRRKRPRPEDDEGDDRPKPKRKGGKKAGKGGLTRGQMQLLIFGGAGAVLLLVALVVLGVIFGPTLLAPPDKTMAGVGWYEGHEEVNYAVVAYFPGGKPTYDKSGVKVPDALVRMNGGGGEDLSWSVKSWEVKYKGREYAVVLFTYPKGGGTSGAMEDAIHRQQMPEVKGATQTTEYTTLGGKSARRTTTRGAGGTTVSVTAAAAGGQVVASVSGKGEFDHTDPLVAAFFDNITLK